MVEKLLHTNADYVCLLLRVVAGIIIFPYGMHKLLGWFDAFGVKETLEDLKNNKKLPSFIAWLIIIGQSFGSIALIFGFLGRIAAAGNFIIFTGALIVHSPDGWMLNWFNKKKGEGIEYFVLLLTLLLVIIIKGSGALSVDLWLSDKI